MSGARDGPAAAGTAGPMRFFFAAFEGMRGKLSPLPAAGPAAAAPT